VGPTLEIPTAEHVYRRPGAPLIGCNRIACSACGARVRSFAGVRIARSPRGAAERRALYTTADPAASPFLTPERGGALFRVYACECEATETSSSASLDRELLDIDTWRCGGHPEAP
jgi:hypothetical protein